MPYNVFPPDFAKGSVSSMHNGRLTNKNRDCSKNSYVPVGPGKLMVNAFCFLFKLIEGLLMLISKQLIINRFCKIAAW